MDNTVILQSPVTWEGLIDSIPGGIADRSAELLFERYRPASNKEEFVAALIAKLTMAAIQTARHLRGRHEARKSPTPRLVNMTSIQRVIQIALKEAAWQVFPEPDSTGSNNRHHPTVSGTESSLRRPYNNHSKNFKKSLSYKRLNKRKSNTRTEQLSID